MREIELIDKRKRREKHFLQEDGTIIAKIYSEDVHYLENGKYEEIDNTLIEENEYYTNRKNSYKVQFSKQTQKKLMKLENSNHYLDIKLEQEKTVSLIKEIKSNNFMDKVKYKNILDNIDLEYKVLPNKVKESIIIKERINIPSRISFIVDTDLNLILNNDKSISAIKNGNTYFVIDAPYMVDAEGKINKNIYYELVSDVNGYKLNLILDTIWLNNKDVLYPIIIDPTITNRGDEINIYDTYIYPGDTGVDKNSQDILKAGVERVNGNDVINRTLIKFDLPVIGTGSQIIDANLQLIGYPTKDSTYSQDIMEVRRITSEWNETDANWDNMNDKFDNSRIDGSFYAQRSYAIGSTIPVPTQCFVDLTDLVKRWYTDLPNNGIMIKCNNEVYKNDKFPAFFSKNNNAENFNPKPIIQITYRNQNGIEKYMKYVNCSFFEGSSYANLYNGNLVSVFKIAQTVGENNDVTLKIVYNTNDIILNNIYGNKKGWKFNLYQTIEKVIIDSVDYLKYLDEDGTIHYFKKSKQYNENGQIITISEENEYYDEDGLELTIIESNEFYVMKDKKNVKMKFLKDDNIGYLTEIIDNDKSIIIQYNSDKLISKILGENQSEIIINYEENKMIVSTSDTTVILNCDEEKILSITKPLGSILFSYSDKKILNSITDVTGKKVCFDYYSELPYKIKKITGYGINGTESNYLNFIYNFSSTTIVDNNNRTATYTFNKYGNVSSMTNLSGDSDLKNAYGNTYNYGESYQSKNKTNKMSYPIKYVKNYLTNTSFENEDLNFNTGEDINIIISNDCAVSGNKSLKIVNTVPQKEISQSVIVPKNNYYTFSVYMKNNNKAKLLMSYLDSDNNDVEYTSEIIESNNRFVRYDVSGYYPQNAKSDLKIKIQFITIGTSYIDDIQLEEGEVANKYNYLENSDFSSDFKEWSLVGNLENYEIVNLSNISKALKIKMNPGISTGIDRKINISGVAGDRYLLSFWYKNEGLYTNADDVGYDIYNNVSVYFDYNDQMGSGIPLSNALNPNSHDWQYFSFVFGAKKDYDAINIRFFEIMNANNLYITNISLFKDEREQHFSYDKNGNIVKSIDLSQNVNELKYNKNNQLISLLDPKGRTVLFEYDNEYPNRLINNITTTGIYNQIFYDQKGNPKTALFTNRNNVEGIKSGLYRLRFKGTNQYINLKNKLISIGEDVYGSNKWYIEKIESNGNNLFRMHHYIISNKCVSVQGNYPVLSSINNDDSLYELIQNENGSYLVKNKGTNLYLKRDNNVLCFSEYEKDNANYEIYIESCQHKKFIENDASYAENSNFLSSVNDSLLRSTYYNFDLQTNFIKSITNAKGQATSYNYNNKNQLIEIISGNKKINYYYNNQNLLSKIVQEDKIYNITYDEFLNTKSVKIGDDIILITNDYDIKYSRLSSSTYGNNNKIMFDYDDFDRLKTLTKMDDTYNYKYDNNGNLAKVLSSKYKIKFYYDLAKRVQQYNFNNFKIIYDYDQNNNVLSKEFKYNDIINHIDNLYDKDNYLKKINFDNCEIEYNYDYLGRVNNKKINNNYEVEYEYISNGYRTTPLIKSINNYGNKYSYKYDKLNNITHIYVNDKLEKKYYYGEYNELVKEDNYLFNQTIKYEYDVFGNILNKKIYEINTFNLLNKTEYSYDNKWKDLLLKFNNDIISYDGIGNPIMIGNNISMTWINGRELSSYRNGENNVTYNYDNNGIRISKNVNGEKTEYYTENNKIILEKKGNNMLYYMRNDLEKLVGFKYNNDIYYYIKNVQNDVVGIMDDNFTLIGKYEYDSFGNILSITDSNGNDVSNNPNHILNINPFRYRSYYYDKESNFYYLNNRYYNPLWGRFINCDGYLSSGKGYNSYNMFCYCDNNFINYNDEDGNSFESFCNNVGNFFKKFIDNAKGIVQGKINDTRFAIKNTYDMISKGSNFVKKKIDVAVDSFVFSVGSGPGFAMDVGTIGNKFGVKYKTAMDSITYKNGEWYCSVIEQESVAFGKTEYSITNFETIYDCETKEVLKKINHKEGFTFTGVGDGNISYTPNGNEIFYGVDATLGFGVGARVKVGWEFDLKG